MPYVITASSGSQSDDFSCSAQLSSTGDGKIVINGPLSAQAIRYSIDGGETWTTLNPAVDLPHTVSVNPVLIKVEGAIRNYSAIAANIPDNIEPPYIEGVPIIESSVSAFLGVWEDADQLHLAWYRGDPENGGTLIAEAVGSSYTPTLEDYGKKLFIRLTATNSFGHISLDAEALSSTGVQFMESWSDLAIDDTVDTMLSNGWGRASVQASQPTRCLIIADTDAPHGKAASISSSNNTMNWLFRRDIDAFFGDNGWGEYYEELFLFRFDSSTQRIHMRGRTTSATSSVPLSACASGLSIRLDTPYLQLPGQDPNNSAGKPLPVLELGSIYFFRHRMQGSTSQIRMWKLGETEPNTWQDQVTHSEALTTRGLAIGSRVIGSGNSILFMSCAGNAPAPYWDSYVPPDPVSQTFVTEGGETGTYVDGSYWTTGSIIQTIPQKAISNMHLDNGSVYSNRDVHGWQVDPGAAYWRGVDNGTMEEKQAVMYRNDGNGQGFYGPVEVANNIGYSTAAQVPLPISGNCTVIKSETALINVNSAERPALIKSSIMTVVSSPPIAGSIRPGISARSKNPVLNISDVNLDILRNLPSDGIGVPSFSVANQSLNWRVSEQETHNVLSRNIVAYNGPGQPSPYMGYIAQDEAHALLALHSDAYDESMKMALLAKVGVRALDIAERAYNGGIWIANGGHAHGRLAMLSFAAEVFNNDYLREACEIKVQTRIPNVSEASQSVYGDLSQLFYVTQDMIDGSVLDRHPHLQSTLGWPEWGKSYGVDPSSNWHNEVTGEGKLIGDDKSSYRFINSKARIPASLALRLLNDVSARMPRIFHDQADRQYGFEVNGLYSGTTDPFSNSALSQFSKNAYAAWSHLLDIWTPPVNV